MLLQMRSYQPIAGALLAATFLTPPGLAHAEPGDALAAEFQVNTRSSGWQAWPDVATDDSGNFVVVWDGLGESSTDSDIMARRYDAGGLPQGGELRVNGTVSGGQSEPAIAMDADGDFVVAWTGNSSDIFARRFDAAGDPKGNEFKVNTATSISAESPAVAMDADGDFVVAWKSEGPGPGPDFNIFARRYSAAGEPLGTEFQVGTLGDVDFGSHDVAMDDQGNIVVAWTSWPGDGDRYGVLAQRFDKAGVAQGTEFVVSTTTTDEQLDPSVAMDSDGDFVIAWAGYGYGRGDGIFFRRFDAAGSPKGGEFQVVGSGEIRNVAADVAMDADGDFVVSWQKRFPSFGEVDVYGRRYNAAGVALSDEFPVNTFVDNRQDRAAVALDADGDCVFVWQSYDQDGSFYGVYGQRYQGAGPVPNDFAVDGRSDILWRHEANGQAILWEMDGFAKRSTDPLSAPGTEWQVEGLADFDADTKTDILWRNTATGSAVIWLMDGVAKRDAGGIGAPGLEWQILGTGDFDGDDHADILWRNTVSDQVLVWKMEGLSKTASSGLGVVPSVWQVAGVGDFDADATSDVLWRNTATGAAVAWRMADLAKDASAGIGAPGMDWQVEGLADFDADAKSDILWRNTATGATVVWKMDGLAKDTSAGIGKPALVWDIEGAGDTDGGRKADILWRNTATDKVLVWKMDGFAKVDNRTIGTVPEVWQVQ